MTLDQGDSLSDDERMAREEYLSVRVSAEIKRSLEDLAAADKRSVASYVNILLEEHIKAAKAKGVKARKS